MSHNWVGPFLDALRATGNVSESARRAGIASTSVYLLRKSDADFANAWDNALEDATDELELEARNRALHGTPEPVIYQGQLTPLFEYDSAGQVVIESYDTGLTKDGQPVMGSRPKHLVANGKPQFLTVSKKSDALMALLLKGLRKKYGTETTELTGKDGAPLDALDSTQRAARVAALMEIARQRKDAAVDDCSDLV